MTPEEKLLALIQQDKPQPSAPATAGTAPASQPMTGPTASQASVVAPAPAAGTTPAVDPVPPKAAKPAEPPATEKKLKLAASAPASPAAPAPAPAAVAKEVPRAVTKPAPAEAAPAPVVAEPAAASMPQSKPAPEAEAPAAAGRRAASQPFRTSGLVFLNRVLAAVVLVLLVGVVYSIASIRADVTIKGKQLEEGAGVQDITPVAAVKDAVPGVEAFLDKVSVRDVFLPSGSGAPTSAVSVAQGKVADLKLVGVSLDAASAEESMAIIRNKADAKTYFVKQGQAVGETEYTLDRVLADRVILKMRKQEIELR